MSALVGCLPSATAERHGETPPPEELQVAHPRAELAASRPARTCLPLPASPRGGAGGRHLAPRWQVAATALLTQFLSHARNGAAAPELVAALLGAADAREATQLHSADACLPLISAAADQLRHAILPSCA